MLFVVAVRGAAMEMEVVVVAAPWLAAAATVEEDGCAAIAADWWCCRCWCVAGNGVMVMKWWPAR